jgi:gamma-glutamyltranspeptidase
LINGESITNNNLFLVESLQSKNHKNISVGPSMFGVTQFISINPDTNVIEAVSDPRKNGAPAGL